MKAPSPLLGFNNNVRHKGRVFHIQTEDSGIRHPHIITHLFADGGRILKTTKTSYAEHIGQEKLAETVRAMMQEQHKAMFIALRDGQFDPLFEEGGVPSPKASQPSVTAASSQIAAVPVPPAPPSPPPSVRPSAAAAAPSPPPPSPPPPSPPPPPPARVVVTPAARVPASPPPPASPLPPAAPFGVEPLPPSRRRGARPTLDVDASAIHGLGASASPVGHRSEPSIDLDLDALERAAAEAQTPFFQQIQDLPPPPAAVLGTKRPSLGSAGGPGGYSVRGPTGAPPPPVDAHGRARTSPLPNRPSPSPLAPAGAAARYAPSRPASIFATTRPQEGTSIFGEDLISEKSLDEVILSYLAEDLDGPAEKK